MLCTDGAATFYRKYAFGADGAKLAEQLAWLRRNAARLPLVRNSARGHRRRLLLV